VIDLFVEKVEQRYSIAVVVGTPALFAVPMAAGAAFEPTLLRAMTFMIVASPCAVVLATMPPLLSAIANASRHGVLVKSAVVLEGLGQADVVAFDKTGTLTEGAPRVCEVEPVPAGGCGADELLALAAAAERGSEHPIARAVVAAARERSLDVPAAAEGFDSSPGQVVSAIVAGRHVRVGYPALLDPPGLPSTWCAGSRPRGLTAVVVLVDDAPAGVLAVTDRLRPGARETVAALTALTGRSPILLTGDNYGINDAPAMAAAHIGVAMGRHGSDLALETADAIIVRDELATLPQVVRLSRRAHGLVRANLAIAATVIVALVGWDVVDRLPLPLGVAGHEGSTVLVALNGLRLLHPRAWRRAGSR
jgi:cation-transporting P-type ATPase J